MTHLTVTQLLYQFLNSIGYEKSFLYAGYSYLHPTLYFLLAGATMTVSFLVPGLLYLLVTRMPLGRVLPSDKVAPTLWIALFATGLCLAMLSNLPANWVSGWVQSLLPQMQSFSLLAMDGYGISPPLTAILLYLIHSTILPAFFEEFIFRGILLGQLRRWGDGLAIFISAFLFGLFHSNLQQIPFAFLVGLVLGFLVVRTNNLWLSIAIHFANNTIASFPDAAKFFLSDELALLIYNLLFYGVIVLGAVAALYLVWRHRSFFLPRPLPCQPLSLPSRILAWTTAPGMWLIVIYRVLAILFPWV